MARVVTRSITGLDTVSAVLQQIPVDLRASILRGAVAAAAEPIKQAAKANARRSVRTGALYASIDVKTITAKGAKNASATAIVGPSRDRFTRGGVKVPDVNGKRAKSGGEQPARYAHLIEFGHAVRQPKKGRTTRNGNAVEPKAGSLRWVAPRPFMRPALQSTQGKTMQIMLAEIDNGIERTRKRLVKSGAIAA